MSGSKNRSKSLLVALLNFLIFAFLFILHYTKAFQIGNLKANPVSIIPFLVAFSMYNEEWAAAFTGMAIGIFMDSTSVAADGFHTLVLGIIGLTVAFIVHYLFNNNLRSAIALSLLASLFYFVLRWLFFHAIGGNIDDSIYYLMQYALPSVLYTSIFIFPFYYLQRKFYQIKIG